MTNTIHPFEKVGFGRAPFKFLGVTENMWRSGDGSVVKPGGSCDYCGTGIRYEFHIQSYDGKRFKVGSECVRKVESKGSRLLTDIERALKLTKNNQKVKNLVNRTIAAKEKLNQYPNLLLDKPHPTTDRLTLRNYVEFLFQYGGITGKTKACKIVENTR